LQPELALKAKISMRVGWQLPGNMLQKGRSINTGKQKKKN
jgi:hypothetical protein